MPRRARPLTALQVARAKPGRHTDGGGLNLLVTATSASWVLRYTSPTGTRRDMGLGPARGHGALTLAEAREVAEQHRALLREGKDPIAIRDKRLLELSQPAPAIRTFEQAAQATLEARAEAFSGERYRAQWMSSLRSYILPELGHRDVAKITAEEVAEALRPIWTRVPETASRVRQRVEQVFSHAIGRGWRPKAAGNPATWRDNLSLLLPSPQLMQRRKREREGGDGHHPALPPDRMPDFMKALLTREGMSALALRFAILTASRSGTVRGMRWSEADLQGGVWTIPARRMKNRVQHRVPLTDAMLALLQDVHPLALDLAGRLRRDQLVFPGSRPGCPLSDMGMLMLVRGMATDGLEEGEPPRWRDELGRVVVPHGFRTTFKEWARRSAWTDELSELALAHRDRNEVRAAYARQDLVEERRPLMEAWCRFCYGSAHVGHSTPELLSTGSAHKVT